jgi:hypothetical protein
MSNRWTPMRDAGHQLQSLLGPIVRPRSVPFPNRIAFPWRSADLVPFAIFASVAVGLSVLLGSLPIDGRGDYGQWLMTSRYYLGQSVPDYRTVSALPPLIPILLAGVRSVVPDAGTALQIFTVLLLLTFAVSLYLVGWVLMSSQLGGLFAVALGLVVSDRFLELFAFGGLFQAGALAFLNFSIAALLRAGQGPNAGRRWWVLGTASLAGVALSHEATGLLAVPIGMSVAGVSLLRLKRLSWDERRRALLLPIAILLGVVAYWVIVLVPGSHDYVSNPASLSYRGPGRLFAGLGSYWPTATVMVVGGVAIVLGGLGDALRRVPHRYLILVIWTGVAWSALGFSVVSQAATDYPRFATPLLIPLVLGAAGGLLWLSGSLAGYLQSMIPRVQASVWAAMCVAVLILIAAPFSGQRYVNEVNSYQPLDVAGLSAVAEWLDSELPPGDAVLSPVREGKWIEGITGRAALFSLPVRYAFRAAEWQRSVAADTLLRSSSALTNGYFFAKFESSNGAIPRGLLLASNHGGEFVDLLRSDARQTQIMGKGPNRVIASLASLRPTGVRRVSASHVASIRTTWRGTSSGKLFAYTESVAASETSRMIDIVEQVTTSLPVAGIQLQLRPPLGVHIEAIAIDGRSADLTFSRYGQMQPRVRVSVPDGPAVIQSIEGGGVLIRSTGSKRLHVELTALSAAGPSVGASVLYPPQIVEDYHVGAAVLVTVDPTYPDRIRRLEALGFHAALRSGMYEVLVRGKMPAPIRGLEP